MTALLLPGTKVLLLDRVYGQCDEGVLLGEKPVTPGKYGTYTILRADGFTFRNEGRLYSPEEFEHDHHGAVPCAPACKGWGTTQVLGKR